ncbi:uncharacterized protein HMPREF1541_06654 [Cyphellophora europaea CBS 101466]|uniref:Zn(2)-C6 fungal-type domain-containing protein n=1 Tax=Cyphellophora europaea (strain CBS 101466) TaxID=1220924 RepID=W2RQ68_CYPE1|nr:uncharacterized protein HMPREF1541_06654 [Cyphellophora europaea CBS 101466]ETN38617.1 hypothetical protein HMPREF1541_06654 [Cyphellophora europaea CBS 101466]
MKRAELRRARSQSPESGPVSSHGSPAKRPRTALACQRCKSRKQKCDGQEPSCTPCLKSSKRCQYVASTVLKPTEQRTYVKTLELKVADLESRLRDSEASARGGDDEFDESYRLSDVPPENPLSKTIRDLSLNASGYSYLGGTSNVTLGHLLGPVLQIGVRPTNDKNRMNANDPDKDPLVTRRFSSTDEAEVCSGLPLTEPVVEQLFEAYMDHVSHLFPVIHSPKLREMHARRSKPKGPFEVCVLHLVYAIGGVTLSSAERKGEFRSDEHYEAAMLDRNRITRCFDRREIILLSLASLYCLRAPRSPGPWSMIALAVKLCTSLGLHRKTRLSKLSLRTELDRRLFWSCYRLDRDINLAMGRPLSICDHDIDCPLPLDVNEDSVDLEDFRKAHAQDKHLPASPSTSLTYFVHMTRLTRIVSKIQHTIYRVDQPVEDFDIIRGFLTELAAWDEATLPVFTPEHSLLTDGARVAASHLQPRERYQIEYHTAMRFLLFPCLGSEDVVDAQLLKKGTEACVGVCTAFKTLHRKSPAAYYSPLSVMSLFLAGLTLIHCGYGPNAESHDQATVAQALTDCTIMLYVMAERWPRARKFRDIFERLKQISAERQSQRKSNEGSSGYTNTANSFATMNGHQSMMQPNRAAVASDSLIHLSDNYNTVLGMAEPTVPDMILDIVREPFPLWDEGNFNFEAFMENQSSMATGDYGAQQNDFEWDGHLGHSFTPSGCAFMDEYYLNDSMPPSLL